MVTFILILIVKNLSPSEDGHSDESFPEIL
jgi:hypothetical protein